jgi:hypothetical protein
VVIFFLLLLFKLIVEIAEFDLAAVAVAQDF